MNEDKLLEKIKHSARKVEPSAKLEPEFIKDRLGEDKQPKRWIDVYRYGKVAAAVCVLILGGTVLAKSGLIGQNKDAATESVMDMSVAESAQADAKQEGWDDEMALADMAEAEEAIEEGEEEESAEKSESTAAGISEGSVDLNGVLAPAESYDQIVAQLEEYYADSACYAVEDAEEESTGAPADGAAGGEPGTAVPGESNGTSGGVRDYGIYEEEIEKGEDAGEDNGTDHSTTNIQELGVDEGDIVKTDGKYIYILKKDSSVQILEADGANIQEKGQILNVKKNAETTQEMYVTGDKLILISDYSEAELTGVAEDVVDVRQTSGVKAYTYDISNRDKPRCLGIVEQEGNYSGSRLVDGYLYLYTDCYKDGIWLDDGDALEDGYEESSYFPSVGGSLLEAREIYIPDEIRDTNYMVFGSVDLENPNKIKDKKAVMSMSYLYYVSTKSIYLTQQEWTNAGDSTTIVKMDFEDGNITPKAAGVVKGSINDSFSMNEYDGHLRVVTTSWGDGQAYNHLYVLDERMNITGFIENLAPDETIQSARFLGDVGYFVTYRNMDPLFSVDLSDPYNPQILGELKITGFSSYLHFYGENLLFGLGHESDPNDGRLLGVKLSMYDISDPSNVQEVHKLVLDIDDSAALSNYKSLLIDPRKNLIGFGGEDYNYQGSDRYESCYYLYKYDPEQGFVNLLTEELGGDRPHGTRGIYIGDTFYLANVYKETLISFDMKQGYAKTGETVY